MEVAIYNGAGQPDYLFGLVSGLNTTPIKSIEIFADNISAPLFESFDKINFHIVFNRQKKGASIIRRVKNIISFYFMQSGYLIFRTPKIVHFQWLDRYFFLDRLLLPFLARLRGNKVVLTVHNVNAGKRNENDSFFNRLTLSVLYNLCDHFIVHTEQCKREMEADFKINPNKISVIKHGMNNKVAVLGKNQKEARDYFQIDYHEKVILFFGNIDYYKGLDLLIDSLNYLNENLINEISVIIAGNSKTTDYANLIRYRVNQSPLKSRTIMHIKYINDHDIESYFMAADCIVLPYRKIYQSGVVFMAYNFGLPIIATDVGNFRNDIIQSETGYIVKGIEPYDIAKSIEEYFHSSMYQNLPEVRKQIKEWAYKVYSWESIGQETYQLYSKLIE